MSVIPAALAAAPLACPLDGLALDVGPDGLRCAAGHNFDVSRRGYADLLPVRWKPSKAPGDDPAMVAARRRVLEAGLFDPVVDAVVKAVRAALRELGEAPAALVDAGCGEGTYTARLHAALAGRPEAPGSFIGTDISKPAIALAARRGAHVADAGTEAKAGTGDGTGAGTGAAGIAWAVANNVRLPVLAGAAGTITSLFGFETWEPWASLQVPGQRVVVASAGPDHLIELRELVYDEVRRHGAPDDGAALRAGYACVREARLREVRPCAGLGGDVLAMTPHAHRIGAGSCADEDDGPERASPARPPGLADRVTALDTLTLDVVLRDYRLARGGASPADGRLD